MTLEERLHARCAGTCELCKETEGLLVYAVPPQEAKTDENCIMVCNKCFGQIGKRQEPDSSHWLCLTESMWSEIPAVQVVSWRMLNRFRNESWAMDQLDMMYLNDENLAWAQATGDHENDTSVSLHRDCNGAVLQAGDTVILTKSLDVKGSTLNAKMGTVVKNIRLVEDNTDQIEGKIEGQVIVILTKYVRKQS